MEERRRESERRVRGRPRLAMFGEKKIEYATEKRRRRVWA